LEAVGRAERDRAHDAVAELLLHLQRDLRALHLQRVVHLRHLAARELHVDDRADDLNDLALTHFVAPVNFILSGRFASSWGFRDWEFGIRDSESAARCSSPIPNPWFRIPGRRQTA